MSGKRSFLKPAWPEALLLGLCAAICSFQILVPPYIGLANNGDFPKVYARFACAPPDGDARNFIYFVADYEFRPRHFWKSDVQSSENALAAVPILLVKASGARVFNIRWLGASHLLLFLCAYGTLLVYLRRRGRVFQLAIGGFALWIFTDVAYVSYFNSFFSDTAALLGLRLMAAFALHLVRPIPRAAALWLFTAAALLFIASKTQHALWGIFPVLFLGCLGFRTGATPGSGQTHPGAAAVRERRRTLLAAAVLLAAEAYMLLSTPPLYSAHPLFSTIFLKLAPNSSSPEGAVRAVGLGEDEYRYIGTQTYSPGTPTVDVAWLIDFNRRTGYGKLLRYWLRHPGEALQALHRDLVSFAPLIRQLNLSNFRREDGHPPGALTGHFASWSALHSGLYRRWPGHIVLWYALVIAGAGAVFIRRPSDRWPAAICLGICAMAILEFCFASLADANETGRHLLIFHALTEITICFAAAAALDLVQQMAVSHNRIAAVRSAGGSTGRPQGTLS
jgi:hypothetical protein